MHQDTHEVDPCLYLLLGEGSLEAVAMLVLSQQFYVLILVAFFLKNIQRYLGFGHFRGTAFEHQGAEYCQAWFIAGCIFILSPSNR